MERDLVETELRLIRPLSGIILDSRNEVIRSQTENYQTIDWYSLDLGLRPVGPWMETYQTSNHQTLESWDLL